MKRISPLRGGLYGLALLLFMAVLRLGLNADAAGPIGWTAPGNALVNADLTVLTGDVTIGNGTPDVTQNGEDLYVEGTTELDGAVRVDGNVTFNGTTNLGLSTFTAGIEFEGATADAFETTLAVTDPTTPDKTITLPDATGTVMLSSLATNGADVANAVTGASNSLVFEGATANGFEASVTVTDPTADRTLTIPDGSGSVFLTSLSTNVADAANAVTGTTNGFLFEGATADGFETTLASTDVGADATITLPAATGTLARILTGTAPAATCTAGEIFVDTDETVDTNCTTTADNSLCLCVAANTWAALENN